MAVQFRLLGDVQVRVDGRLVDPGHARQQCVLVALLVDANRVVSVDQLLDRVWAGRPPQRARNALSAYMSRLRRIVAATGEVAISREPRGYQLAVDPSAIDVHRFHDLAVQARAARRKDDAAALFAQALGLWHGEPFAGLDTPWLDDVRNALYAQRLAVALDRNDLALAGGQHTALLEELATGAAAYPLDERLAGQLMLALYRCGRQADALHHYERLRRVLADELGADPSPPLGRLHQQILTADPALTLPAVAPSRPAPSVGGPAPVPRQLPAPPRAFTGRVRELAALDTAVDAAGDQATAVVISAVAGTAGVGKTALAVHWAHRVAERFRDGQLYVNLRGFDPAGSTVSTAEAVRWLLDALGVPPKRMPASLDGQVGLYRSLLAGKRMLVVLDNVRDAEHARPLLPGTPGRVVVVTSRNALTGLVAGEGAHPITLDLFDAAEARDLLVGRLGAERVAAEATAVDEIVDRSARLPLALVIVAAHAVTKPDLPLATLARALRDVRGTLDVLAGADPATDVRAVFSWSYDALTADAARLFRLLGLHPGGEISMPAAASLAGMPIGRVRPLLAELTRAHLTTECAPDRYGFHDLLRAYAGELARETDRGEDWRAALHRVLDHYLYTAHAAAMLLDPHREPRALAPAQPGVTPETLTDAEQAKAWLTGEQRVLLAAVEAAAASGFEAHAPQLTWSFGDFLERRGHWHDWAAALQTALRAARRLGDKVEQAYAHRMLARALAPLGRYDDAYDHLKRALDLFRQLDDGTGQARTHRNLALVLEQQGRFQEALHHAEQALDLLRYAGRPVALANALNNVGWYNSMVGDHRRALPYCRQALMTYQGVGDRYGEAATYDSLGHIHHHLGHRKRAVTCFKHALDLIRDVGNRYAEASVLTHLGDSHADADRPDLARRVWRQALTILDELGHRDAENLRTKLQPR
ncbi:MAG TPA: BTAD domain-containing putative transcriptional regulator [Pilimelia sp.]|nr:BTAD domain-containing putative transcriptional regulator [Pilimelia sp.]